MREQILRFLTARLGNRAAAEDVSQELFIRLRTGQVLTDVASPRAYVYKAAHNAANEYVRASQRRSARDTAWIDSTTQKIGDDTVSQDISAEDALDAKQRPRALMEGLAALPPKCREVFTMCRLEGLSHREIAEKLDISTKTVEKHMTTALKQLMAKLETKH